MGKPLLKGINAYRWADLSEDEQRVDVAMITGKSVDDIERVWTEDGSDLLFAMISDSVYQFGQPVVPWEARPHRTDAADCWCIDESFHLGDVSHVRDSRELVE